MSSEAEIELATLKLRDAFNTAYRSGHKVTQTDITATLQNIDDYAYMAATSIIRQTAADRRRWQSGLDNPRYWDFEQKYEPNQLEHTLNRLTARIR